ncbi:ABC transporter ATP-binding protein [Rothia sp. ZJ1223]|nr:ABC transporter ATP-binding protein [Rothia sp. ZJ1223]
MRVSYQTQKKLRGTGAPCVLSVQNLAKEFRPSRKFRDANPDALSTRGTYRAVEDISIEAYPGEITVVLGANGAGKTTTLSCAQGLQKPDGGSVSLLGEDPVRASAELRAQVGIMLQDGGLPQAVHPLPLLEHIAKMYAHPLPVKELAERLGIPEFNGTTVRRLSGGQKQRVALAAALLGQPKVLFLDEPSAGLDPQSRAVVFDIIREQRDAGTAIVLTTHLLDDAQKLADYVYIVKRGRNVAEGTVEQLLANTANGSTQLSFTLGAGQTFDFEEALSPRRLTGLTAGRKEDTYTLSGEITPAHLAQLTAYFEARNIMPRSFTLAPRTLEDVFLDISGRNL